MVGVAFICCTFVAKIKCHCEKATTTDGLGPFYVCLLTVLIIDFILVVFGPISYFLSDVSPNIKIPLLKLLTFSFGHVVMLQTF